MILGVHHPGIVVPDMEVALAFYCGVLEFEVALEFGRQGLRVNAVCPGTTRTAFLKSFKIDEDIDMSLISRTGLLDEMAEAKDMADSICFLASDEARFSNGAILSVDGGSTAG